MDLKDKRVIITGGVKGIGYSLVTKMTGEGAIVGVVDKDAQGLKALREKNQNIFCIECDVTNYQQVETTVDEFYKEFKKIDILINNAGILYSAPLISLTTQGIKKHDVNMWEKVISTNLSAVFYMTVNVVEKMMINRTKGVIANISSVSAAGNVGQSAYSAAKSGINALTATWSKELSPIGIRVVAVAPGYSDTESTHQALSEDILKDIIKKVPLKRLGRAEEIADGVIHVIKNEFFNGKIFELDGGLII
jgi:3-oxoacyl-[acyl-carrier protein] reductase